MYGLFRLSLEEYSSAEAEFYLLRFIHKKTFPRLFVPEQLSLAFEVGHARDGLYRWRIIFPSGVNSKAADRST
jgi:hypothetical protein